MSSKIYDITSYYSHNQGNRWTYRHKAGVNESEVTHIIEGSETFSGVEVPKKVQADNPEEYFCTLIDPIYGIRDFKHHIGMSPNYLIYTPPTLIIPARMSPGEIHYNVSHLFRQNYEGKVLILPNFLNILTYQGLFYRFHRIHLRT